MNRRVRFPAAVLSALLAVWPVSAADLMERFEGFDRNAVYDIYCQAGERGVYLVEDVRILRLVAVNRVPFLVISGGGSAVPGGGDRGYILFSSVQAVLPAGTPALQPAPPASSAR